MEVARVRPPGERGRERGAAAELLRGVPAGRVRGRGPGAVPDEPGRVGAGARAGALLRPAAAGAPRQPPAADGGRRTRPGAGPAPPGGAGLDEGGAGPAVRGLAAR